jgi:hypothetical protein
MKRTGLALAMALLAAPMMVGGVAAQMRPVRPAPPVTVPSVVPVLEKACLPVAGGGPVAAGIAAAKSLGFAVTAAQGGLATLHRAAMVLNLAPGNCVLTLEGGTDGFAHVDHELTGWLPRLGRYWAGGLEADAAGRNARKFRAGGHTVLVWEMVDEGERQLNINIGK